MFWSVTLSELNNFNIEKMLMKFWHENFLKRDLDLHRDPAIIKRTDLHVNFSKPFWYEECDSAKNIELFVWRWRSNEENEEVWPEDIWWPLGAFLLCGCYLNGCRITVGWMWLSWILGLYFIAFNEIVQGVCTLPLFSRYLFKRWNK